MTAAAGMAVGLGRLWLALISVVLALLILAIFGQYRSGNGPDPGGPSA
jgi:uncharacterized membrane protein YhiD involved in acid resistance